MRPPPRKALCAVILAGGQGQRMGGRDKARLRWRSDFLAQHLIRALRPEVAQIILVRRHCRGAWRTPGGVRLAWDRPPSQGPVSGLEAGLRRAGRAWCLCIPVDSLPPPPYLAARLARGSRHGAYVQHRQDHYYLHNLIARRSRPQLDAFMAQGGRSAANACRSLGLAAVKLPPARRAVWSINTPAQWRQFQRQARC